MCLRNQPTGIDIVGIAKCGNGLLEKGEQCDCGTSEVKYLSEQDIATTYARILDLLNEGRCYTEKKIFGGLCWC